MFLTGYVHIFSTFLPFMFLKIYVLIKNECISLVKMFIQIFFTEVNLNLAEISEIRLIRCVHLFKVARD